MVADGAILFCVVIRGHARSAGTHVPHFRCAVWISYGPHQRPNKCASGALAPAYNGRGRKLTTDLRVVPHSPPGLHVVRLQ
jgi:hypothetical protein